jgi:hypothetical protein
MTSQNGLNQDREAYLEAWSQMMINIWQEKILMLIGPGNTGALYQSLTKELMLQSDGDISKIVHLFNYYGVYVDAGVGRGFSHGNGGDLGFTPIRKPKPWLSPKYYASIHKLAEKMSDFDGEEFAIMMQRIIGSK